MDKKNKPQCPHCKEPLTYVWYHQKKTEYGDYNLKTKQLKKRNESYHQSLNYECPHCGKELNLNEIK